MKKSLICAMAIFFSLSLWAEGEVVETFANINQPSATSAYSRAISSFDNQLPLIYRNARCGTADTIGKTQGIWLCRVVGSATKYNSYVELGQDENTTEGRKEIKFEGGVKGISFAYRQFGYDSAKGDDNARFILALKINGTPVDSVQFDPQPQPALVSGVFTKTLDVKVPAKITIANLSCPKDNPSTHTYGRMVVGPITITPYLLYTKKNVQVATGSQYTNETLIDNRNNQNPIQYSSSNTDVATVDANGLVTTIKEGTTTISASWDGITTTYALTVDGPAKQGLHRVGTYNIRTSGASADTGDKAWSARRDAVVTMIRDTMAFDVVSLQEVSTTQHNYLKEKLGSTYTILYSGTAGGAELLYRTEKYECLDNGTFWLAPDPSTKPSKPSWDAEYVRMTVWAKLKDKQTGEIFVFGATHLDLNPVSIREGARVNTEQLSKIAGDYPCVVTGDMNCEPIDHDPHANFGVYFANSRQVTKTAPRGSYNTFSSGMNPIGASKLIDFVYVHNIEVEDYYTSASTIGRSLLPSDHLPTVCTVTLLPTNREKTHYVSSLDELRQVAKTIQPNDTIIVEGDYDFGSEPLKIANTCVIIGKNCTITGQTNLFQLADFITLDISNIHFKNVTLSANTPDGGVLAGSGLYLHVSDCIIEDCTTEAQGLVCNNHADLTLDHCIFRHNMADKMVGCVYMTNDKDLVVKNCLYQDNQAAKGAAIYATTTGKIYIYGSSFIGNVNKSQGSVAVVAPTSLADVRVVNSTFANNKIDVKASIANKTTGGSAIFLQGGSTSQLTLMQTTVVGNYTSCLRSGVSASDFVGGAIYVMSGNISLTNNIIAGNYSSCPRRGDISLVDSTAVKTGHNNIFSCQSNMNYRKGLTDVAAEDWTSACNELVSFLGGTASTTYQPALMAFGSDKEVISIAPLTTTYASKNIQNIAENMLKATYVGSDIMNEGGLTGTLERDQVGAYRAPFDPQALVNKSVPGAIEYGTKGEPVVSLKEILFSKNINCSKPVKTFHNGRIVINLNGAYYNLLGQQE